MQAERIIIVLKCRKNTTKQRSNQERAGEKKTFVARNGKPQKSKDTFK